MRKIELLMLFVALILTVSCKKEDDTEPTNNSQQSFSELETKIVGEMTKESINGLSAFIIKGNETVWIKGFGKADVANNKEVSKDTPFMLGSVSKAVTSIVLLTLYDAGKFKLDDNINDYLPFKVINPHHPNETITFKMLLAHAGSINDAGYDELDDSKIYTFGGDTSLDLGEFLKDYLVDGGKYYSTDSYTKDKPGAGFKYSNVGSALCGYLAEAISGEKFSDYSKKVLFTPLGMNNTGWWLKDVNIDQVAIPYQNDGTAIQHYTFVDYPNGQLRSSVEDMSKLMLMFMQQGTLNGQKILESTTVDLIKARAGFVDSSNFGLSWYYDKTSAGDEILGHNGSERGVQTEFFLDTKSGVGVMVTANKTTSLVSIRDLLFEEAKK
ncbi:serine hydrolase domain-containing protein [Microscilla marina]|nr:serine hydrolase domain-containing protein [Microscilla marina]